MDISIINILLTTDAPGINWPLFIGLVVLLAGIVAIVFYVVNSRARVMRYLSQDLGFRFSARDIWDIPKRYEFIEAFATGQNRQARNVIYSVHGGAEIKIFDYSCYTESDGSKVPHKLSCVVFDFQGFSFPHTHLTIKDAAKWTLSKPSLKEFKGCSEQFSSRYNVDGEDIQFIKTFLTEDLQTLILRIKSVGLDVSLSSLVFYCEDVLSPNELRDIHMIGWKIRKQIPDELLSNAASCKLPE